MRVLTATVGGFLLDLLFGDPEFLTQIHPVVLMGRAISRLEKALRARFPKTERGSFAAGLTMALILVFGTLLLSFGILRLLGKIHPELALAAETLWCWQALAAKDLRVEALRVYDALTEGTLEQARTAVARIVGRDTGSLDEAGSEETVIVAHGGTQMAALERWGSPEKEYYRWQTGCGCGWMLDWNRAEETLQVLEKTGVPA